MALNGIGRDATGNISTSEFRSPNLQAALSTQIKIFAGIDTTGSGATTVKLVGAIQSFAPTETRPLVRISEVGTDGVIEIVPQSSATCEIAVNRMVFDYQRLPAAFQKGIRHIHAARLPFHIQVKDYNAYVELGNSPTAAGQVSANNSPVITWYTNCWITSYSYTYSQDNFLITETATIWVEHVYDADSGANISQVGDDTYEFAANFSKDANVMTAAHSAYVAK